MFGSFFQDVMEVSASTGDASVKSICVRAGCTNPAVDSKDWDKEYCSNECVATHCRCAGLPSCLFFFTAIRKHFLTDVLFFAGMSSKRGAPSGTRTWGL